MKFLIKNILWIVTIIASLFLLLGLIYNTFIPTVAIYVLGGVAILNIIVSRFKYSKIIKILVIIAIFITSGFLFYVQYSAEKVLSYNKTETSIITFVVLADSKIISIEDAKNSKFGVSETMDKITNTFLSDQLTTKIQKYSWNSVTDDQTNMEKLYSGDVDVMVLDNSMRDYLIEVDPKFESKTRVIWTVEKTSVKEVIVKEVDISEKPFIVFISGIDVAGPITTKSRSDVNIIMVVNPTTNKILTVSIPRDTYTPLGCETGAYDKLTHAGNFGINCSVKTIENLVGIDINYYVRVNFSSVIKIIDVIGNVDVYSKYSFTDDNGAHFNSGINSLNSTNALIFARARHQFADGDIQRGLNQQELIKGMIAKLTSLSTLTKIDGIISATSKSIDTNMSTDDLSKLIKRQLENNKAWEISTSNLSGVGDMKPTYSMGSRLLYVMHPDAASLARIKQNISDFMIVAE